MTKQSDKTIILPRTRDEYEAYKKSMTYRHLSLFKELPPNHKVLDEIFLEHWEKFYNKRTSFRALVNAQPTIRKILTLPLDPSDKTKTVDYVDYNCPENYRCLGAFMMTFGDYYKVMIFDKPLCMPYNNPHKNKAVV
jgi:hypothetical protein